MNAAPSPRMGGRREALRRRRRRLTALGAAVAVAALLLVIAGPWFGHLGLPWPGGRAGAAESGGDLRVIGVAANGWSNAPVTLRFRDADGKPVTAGWRLDGGAWEEGLRVHVRAPADHSGDGVHTVQVRPAGGGEVATTVTVRIDTRPPEISDVGVTPDLIDGAADVKLRFTAAPEDGVEVEWAVIDALGKAIGEQGAPQAPSGAVSTTWRAAGDGGAALGTGTYWLRVRAEDAAGNVSEERAPLACEHAVKARVISSLPAAGRMVALTFDGGSGYAWRSIMNTLHAHGAAGSFFCTGVSIEKYPEIARLAVEQGHTIGNHSIDHPDFSDISYAEQVRQLEGNAKAWREATGAVPEPFFRPPYGSYTDKTLKAAGKTGYRYVAMWNGDAGDWRGLSAKQVVANALAAAKPGAIIVFHTQWNTDAAMPAVLKGLEKKNLKPVGLAELCEAAGLPY